MKIISKMKDDIINIPKFNIKYSQLSFYRRYGALIDELRIFFVMRSFVFSEVTLVRQELPWFKIPKARLTWKN